MNNTTLLLLPSLKATIAEFINFILSGMLGSDRFMICMFCVGIIIWTKLPLLDLAVPMAVYVQT